MPTLAATVTFLFPDCCAETFKLPRPWQALADHRQPVLNPLPVAESSVVSMPCSRTASVWQIRLSHWPEPLRPLPAQPMISSFLHRTHMHTRKPMHETPMLFHSPLALFTFLLLPRNNTRHLICNSEYTHTYTHIYRRIHTGPNLTLKANLTSSERCVGLHRPMCTQSQDLELCYCCLIQTHITGS